MSQPADIYDLIHVVEAEAMGMRVSWPVDQMDDPAVRVEVRQHTRTMQERADRLDQVVWILGVVALDPDSFRLLFDLARKKPAEFKKLADRAARELAA